MFKKWVIKYKDAGMDAQWVSTGETFDHWEDAHTRKEVIQSYTDLLVYAVLPNK